MNTPPVIARFAARPAADAWCESIASWSLKEVASWCGFAYTTDLDGFEVGLSYEEYRAFGEPIPIEEIARYKVEDVRALVCVAERLKQPGVKDITAYGG